MRSGSAEYRTAPWRIGAHREEEPAEDAGRLSPRNARVVALCLLGAAFLLDDLTGNEISSSLYYVVAITFGSWFLGRRVGLALALLSTVGWWTSYLLVGRPFSRPEILVWNLVVELAIYIITAMAVAQASYGLARQRLLARSLDEANHELEREARKVGELQRELLPRSMPQVRGYLLEARYEPSSRAGGDYYDFFALENGRIGILVADASGHGTAAAVLMAMTRVLLHTPDESLSPPARALAQLQSRLAPSLPENWFVTACYAILDVSSGRLDYSLAGHPAPIVLRAGASAAEPLPLRGGPPLGLVRDGSDYLSGSTVLQVGDTLLFYTDGLTEAMNASGDPLGEERLHAALARVRGLDLDEACEGILAIVRQHAAGQPLADDLTLLLLRKTGS